MIVHLTDEEVASAVVQAVGRKLQLADGAKVKVKLVHVEGVGVSAEVDVGDMTSSGETRKVGETCPDIK